MEYESFINAYVKHSGAVILDRAQAALIWESFRKFMIDWVLTKNGGVDLGFCTLMALPLRRNWMEVMNQRINGRASRFKRDVRAWQLSAWDRENEVIRWDIVAVASERFHEAALKMELARKAPDERKYRLKVRKAIHENNERMHAIFKAYVAETHYPNYPIGERTFERIYYAKSGKIKTWRKDKELLDAPDGGGGVLETSAETNVASADAGVPEMPNLLQGIENVRRNGDVDESANGAGGDVGLRMLSSFEEQADRELLALDSDKRNGGGHPMAPTLEQQTS